MGQMFKCRAFEFLEEFLLKIPTHPGQVKYSTQKMSVLSKQMLRTSLPLPNLWLIYLIIYVYSLSANLGFYMKSYILPGFVTNDKALQL